MPTPVIRFKETCSLCLRVKEEVKRLVKVHNLYICSDCCETCKNILENEEEVKDSA